MAEVPEGTAGEDGELAVVGSNTRSPGDLVEMKYVVSHIPQSRDPISDIDSTKGSLVLAPLCSLSILAILAVEITFMPATAGGS